MKSITSQIVRKLSIFSVLPLCLGGALVFFNDSMALFIGLLVSFLIHLILFYRKFPARHSVVGLLFLHCLIAQGLIFLCVFLIAVKIDGYW